MSKQIKQTKLNIFKRRLLSSYNLQYLLSHITTLREWHIKRALRGVSGCKDSSASIRILDAGCGAGQYVIFMNRLFDNAQIDALDGDSRRISCLSEDFAHIKLNNIKLICQDLQELQGSEEYDLILCSAVLEYIADDNKVIANFVRALKPSGQMVIYQPVKITAGNNRLKAGFERNVADRIAEKQLPLINRYTKEELIDLVKVPGLQIERIMYTHGLCGRIGANIERYFFRSNRLRFPFSVLYLILILIHPIAMLFMLADYALPVRNGAGMIMILKKGNP